jgi:orotidine-5'-phosphate decarboxylase
MNFEQLVSSIKKKKSYLCIGLDTDINKIPKHLLKANDPVFEFNKKIIDSTKDLVVAYKPNLAFYESLGPKGIESLSKTIQYIPNDIFKIADAKRGDIGNTSTMYAKSFFEKLNFDAVTLSPYMGKDSILPYLEFKNKWIILLSLTSNSGAEDFQYLNVEGTNEKLFEKVIKNSVSWSSNQNMMYVVGANRTKDFIKIRKIIPNHFILVPGIGAQGGNLKNVSMNGINNNCGLIVNLSRSIIYSDSSINFEKTVREKAQSVQIEMSKYLSDYNIL